MEAGKRREKVRWARVRGLRRMRDRLEGLRGREGPIREVREERTWVSPRGVRGRSVWLV